MWDLWWTKWHWNRFFSKLSVFPCQFHSTGAPLIVKLGKKTAHLHLHHRVAQKALTLWCVRSICCGALHNVKKKSRRVHGCLCCVCRKDGNMERKVTWRTKGFKQYKNGSKGKNPGQGKKKIPPGAWMFVCCECCVLLSGRGLCDELVPRPEESYRLWCV
jgi:hypothetical protein